MKRETLSAKVEHVLRSKQTRHHTCHWPGGCARLVPPAMWGCARHWRALPKVLKDRVWRTYEIGQEISLTPSSQYLKVQQEIKDWYNGLMKDREESANV